MIPMVISAAYDYSTVETGDFLTQNRDPVSTFVNKGAKKGAQCELKAGRSLPTPGPLS